MNGFKAYSEVKQVLFLTTDLPVTSMLCEVIVGKNIPCSIGMLNYKDVELMFSNEREREDQHIQSFIYKVC